VAVVVGPVVTVVGCGLIEGVGITAARSLSWQATRAGIATRAARAAPARLFARLVGRSLRTAGEPSGRQVDQFIRCAQSSSTGLPGQAERHRGGKFGLRDNQPSATVVRMVRSSGVVEFLVRPRRCGKLDVKRLPVPDAASHELGPVGDLRLWIRGFRQEPPELGMVPAEIVPGAVPMPPDPFSQTQNLVYELLAREYREFLVGCYHTRSLRGGISCVPGPFRNQNSVRYDRFRVGTPENRE
jgi:hypothetical protein